MQGYFKITLLTLIVGSVFKNKSSLFEINDRKPTLLLLKLKNKCLAKLVR